MVFVHGLFSSPKTWDAFVGLLESDEELPFTSVLRFGYASPKFRLRPDRRIPNFNDLAGQLKAFVEHRAKGFDRLLLVAHSQGGLVVQRYLAQMLAQGRGQELARIKGVLLFACPNDGSGFALSLRTSWWQLNPQERALRPFDEQVKDAHRTVIGQVVNATAPGPSTSPIPFWVYGGTEDNVVARASAQGAFPDVAMLPGDHFSIIQPASREADSYLALREHLLEVRQTSADQSDPGPLPGRWVATTRPGAPQEDTLLSVGPTVLEVHPAVLPSADMAQHPSLTPYLIRSHDGLLRQVLAPALKGGPSVLAMLTGESSTGKTRANYEAILELAPARPLFRPATADDLLALVAEGRITAGTVLWLNESQRFLHGSAGARAAAALRGLLERQSGIAAVGTLWQDPYWDELTRQGVPGDPNGQARALLTGPHTRRITVAAELSDDDRTGWETLVRQHPDGRLSRALAAGAGDGRVVQHLSGGPELLAAYLDGPGRFFTHAEHAMLTAALDARRLGHKSPLPAVLLADAADGTLPARYCADDPAWTQRTLSALRTGVRADGSRTDIRCTLTALTALRVSTDATAVYEPADYLEQHIRSHRADQLGSAALWDAMLRHTTAADDLHRLEYAARQRGLTKLALQFEIKSIMAGHHVFVRSLLKGIAGFGDPQNEGLGWIAEQVDPTDRDAVGQLLREARTKGAPEVRTRLLSRVVAAAGHGELRRMGRVLDALRTEGEAETVAEVFSRIVAALDPADSAAVVEFLDVLAEFREGPGATQIPSRRARLDKVPPGEGHELSRELQDVVDETLVAALAGGMVAEVDLSEPQDVALMLRHLRIAEENEAVAQLLARDPASHVGLHRPDEAGPLCAELVAAGAGEAADALLARDPAASVDLADPHSVALALDAFRIASADEAVAALLARAPATHVAVNDPLDIAELLGALRRADAQGAIAALLARNPEQHLPLDMLDWDGCSFSTLLEELEAVGADASAAALQARGASLLLSISRTDLDAFVRALDELSGAFSDGAMSTMLARIPIDVLDLSDPRPVAQLMHTLRNGMAFEALEALLARDPGACADTAEVEHFEDLEWALEMCDRHDAAAAMRARAATRVDLNRTRQVAELIRQFLQDDEPEPLALLLARDPATHAELADPGDVAWLLNELRAAGAEEAIATLLARDPAAQADLSSSRSRVGSLVKELNLAGFEEAARRLTRRAENAGLDKPEGIPFHGRTPDGSPTPPWTWSGVLQEMLSQFGGQALSTG
ncbi:hypothetical protein AB0O31_18990 [Kitasatospora cineracea]|uniref:hypothetical protein n=1 Tax=Kitasatospora cineracea TaxID=88074 RepID=UPI00342C2FC5